MCGDADVDAPLVDGVVTIVVLLTQEGIHVSTRESMRQQPSQARQCNSESSITEPPCSTGGPHDFDPGRSPRIALTAESVLAMPPSLPLPDPLR